MDPELRSQILQALAKAHQALPAGQAPTHEGDDRYIAQLVRGTPYEGKVMGMADLVPSKDAFVTVPHGADLFNAPGDFGRGAMSAPGALLHALAHPLDTGGQASDMFFNALMTPVAGSDVSGRSVGARGGVPIRPAGGVISDSTPGAISPEQASQAQRQLLGTTLFGGGPLGMMAGGVFMNPEHPAYGAGQGAGIALTGAGVAKVASPVVDAARRIGIGDPHQRALNEISQTYLPASAEDPMATISRFAPAPKAGEAPMTTAEPMLAQANPVFANAFMDALKRNPKLYGQYTDMLRKIKSGEIPDLATGIRQARDTWAAPLYDAMRAKYPEIALEKPVGGLTPAEARATPKGSPERAILDRYLTENPQSKLGPFDPIPGTETAAPEGISDIMGRPIVKGVFDQAVKDEELGALPEKGGKYSFQNVRDVIRVLREKSDAAFNADNATRGYALKRAAASLDARLADQIPEYGPVQQEFGSRSDLAAQAEEQGGNLKLPKPPTHVPSKPVTSPFMSVRYMAAKPIIGGLFKGIDQRTAAALADILSTKGPESIQALLEEIARRGKRGPSGNAGPFVPPPSPTSYPPNYQGPRQPTPSEILGNYDPLWPYRGSARERLQP